MILYTVILLLALLVLFFWIERDTDRGENRWGSNPKEEPVVAEALSGTA